MAVNLIDAKPKRLEGLPRRVSMHAAGVCNQPERRLRYPFARRTEYLSPSLSLTTLEELGSFEKDSFSLRTLTVINNTSKKCKEKLQHIP